ncbi:MAG: UvrD-helicase domain-containing protein [Thermoguttaceae bacterium]|nr:UvrD-helicase domain-containing protein [Thermoguttaceae bacterium]MDW8077777.1 UvrD-helicase domain-containing protein [Thermoguttaceae bacterium]
MHDDFLAELTEPQRRAVTHGEGPLLVLAGPGSGKTRVITFRIAFLLSQGIPASQILALTFTNKAAQEVAERVTRLVGQSSIWVGTFHGFCARLLRRHARLVGLEPNFTIYDDYESERVLQKAATRVAGGKSPLPLSAIAQAIHRAKNNLQLPEFFRPRDPTLPADLVRAVYAAYQEELRRLNAVDFDDLLVHVARILGEQPDIRAALDDQYRFVLVDEYQDTNLAQYAIVRAINVDYPNLTVTGDPDQSIYCWRGATTRNILEFERDYPQVTVIRLEENYRSTARILRAADVIIARNTRRKPKRLFTRNPEGSPIRLVIFRTQEDEAAAIAEEIAQAVAGGQRHFRDFAVFFRVNTLSRHLEQAFKRAHVPYQVVNGIEFFRRKEIQDILAYLRLVVNPKDDEAFLRMLQAPPRGIGPRTVEQLIALARVEGVSLAELVQSGFVFASISSRARKPLEEINRLLEVLFSYRYRSLEEFVNNILEHSGYRAWLAKASPDGEERLIHLGEFLATVREFDERHPGQPDVASFLEEAALVGETDRWDQGADRVALMTLHAAKGLEFPMVYIVGLEQGILPYEDTWRDIDELEEERRLLFVGITRACEELVLTRAVYRDYRGQRRLTIPSPFLLELPREEITIEDRSQENVGFVLGARGERSMDSEPTLDQPLSQAGHSTVSGEKMGNLFIAAEFFGGRAKSPSRENLDVGAVVLHPQYGIGRIVQIAGEPAGTSLAVQFGEPTGIVWLTPKDSNLKIIRKAGGEDH